MKQNKKLNVHNDDFRARLRPACYLQVLGHNYYAKKSLLVCKTAGTEIVFSYFCFGLF